jgi:uncharacterized protein (TIGR02301 family)
MTGVYWMPAFAGMTRSGYLFRPMPMRAALLICLLLAVAAVPARAIEGGPAPYDRDLQRLAEIMGALHYLRAICGANEGQLWRNEMQALVDAEAPAGERRDRIVASFNRGYRGFQQTYRSCTPAAGVAVKRFLDEGSKITRDITARYAN